MPAEIKVPIKPAYKSMGFVGSAVTAASTALLVLPTVFQNPGQFTEWCSKVETKYGGIIALVLGASFSLVGNIRRPEVFFNPNKLREASQEAVAETMGQVASGVTLENIGTGIQRVQEIAAAANNEQKINLVLESLNDISKFIKDSPNQFSAQDIAHLPGPTPESQHVNRGQNFREPPRNRFEPPKEDRAPAQQVELSGVPFDVTQSSDGVLTAFNPEEVI